MKVVICGAGIAGLALAVRLDALGAEVVVLEKAAGPRTQGYMMDFFGPGYDAAEAIGILPRLREVAYDIEEATYVDERGRRRAAVDYTSFAKAVQGRLLSIMRPDLERVLREQLSGRVELRFGAHLLSIGNEPGGVRLGLADGTTLTADLLVGADGIHSTVRRLTFGGEEQFVRQLGMHTAAYLFDDPALHAEMDGRFCLTDTVGQQFGLYGLRDGQVAVFAVHRTADRALPADPAAAVRREYASMGWLVPRALDQAPAGAEIYYDVVAQVELPRWSSGRVTLAGDACQALSLLAGQGASVGLAGAFLLAEYLAGGDSIESALERYERDWRPFVAGKQKTARSGARWFLPESRRQLLVRRAALRVAGLPGLNRYVTGAVLGKSTALIDELAAAARQRARNTAPAGGPH
ncbi:Rossmann-fold NAD(P)-binding domain-containing protein [Flindersiella endophytica]